MKNFKTHYYMEVNYYDNDSGFKPIISKHEITAKHMKALQKELNEKVRSTRYMPSDEKFVKTADKYEKDEYMVIIELYAYQNLQIRFRTCICKDGFVFDH